MKRLSKILVIMLFLFQIGDVEAENCSEQELKRLKQLAEAIEINVEYDEDSISLGIYDSYIATVNGMTDELYIISKDSTAGFFPEDIVDGVITERVSSINNEMLVYANKCYSEEILRTINLSMKSFNYFSTYSDCDGLEDVLDVCDPHYEYVDKLTYDKFRKIIDDYKNGNGDIEAPVSINDWLNDYYFIFVGIGIVILLIVIVILIIRHKKKNKLD